MIELKPRTTNGNGWHAQPRTAKDLLAIAFRRRRLIMLSFAGIFQGAVLAILVIPPQYESEMKILVNSNRVDPVVSPEANVIQVARSLVSISQFKNGAKLLFELVPQFEFG